MSIYFEFVAMAMHIGDGEMLLVVVEKMDRKMIINKLGFKCLVILVLVVPLSWNLIA